MQMDLIDMRMERRRRSKHSPGSYVADALAATRRPKFHLLSQAEPKDDRLPPQHQKSGHLDGRSSITARDSQTLSTLDCSKLN
jgi:hypothetical protein